MSISSPFIHRRVATVLLTFAITLAGLVAFRLLPVSPLPQVDFPTVSVSAGLPGASPEIMASSVATPLERQFAHIAGVTEMTSTSSLNSTSITAVRPQQRYKRRGSRCAGGNKCCTWQLARKSAQQSSLS